MTQLAQTHQVVGAKTFEAILVGAVGGLVVSASLTFGFSAHLAGESTWGFFFWDDHVGLRIGGSAVAATVGGAYAGLATRSHGRWVGLASMLPAFIVWALISASVWTGQWPFMTMPLDVPRGSAIVASMAPFTVLLFGAIGGTLGERLAERHSEFLASRPGPLGFSRHHFLWVPFFSLLIWTQVAWAGVIAWYVFRLAWAGELIRFPLVIACAISFLLLWRALAGIYRLITGADREDSVGRKVAAAAKYGLAFPVLAWMLQAGTLLILAPM